MTRLSEATVFWEMGPEDQDYFLRFPRGCKPRSHTTSTSPGTSRPLSHLRPDVVWPETAEVRRTGRAGERGAGVRDEH